MAEHDADQQHREIGRRPGSIHVLAQRCRRNHRRFDRVSQKTLRGWADIGARMSISGIAARISAESPFKVRALTNSSSIFRREIILSMSRWKEGPFPSREPATPAKTGSKFSFSRKMRPTFGTQCLKKEKISGSSHAASVHAIHCASKCVTR